MKTAQILASKDEFLPAAWTARLSALWDAMPPRSWRVVRAALHAELRRCPGGSVDGSPDDVFAGVEESCLAAASVAQVHAATLRRDPPWAANKAVDATSSSPRDVVIKVQVRPLQPRMRQSPSQPHPMTDAEASAYATLHVFSMAE